MNAQEIFDTAVAHVFKQGTRGGVNITDFDNVTRFRCRYRGEGGTKCAVGALLPDDLYDPRMDAENLRASSLVRNGFNVPDYFVKNLDLLDALQTAHDSEWSWNSEENLKRAFSGVAYNYKLSAAILDNLSLPQAAAA